MTFAWDKSANADDHAFDTETDAESDLNATAAAAYQTTNGYAITFDNATAAVGILTAAAVDQTEGTVEFYFDPNSFGLSASKYAVIQTVRNGAGNATWFVAVTHPSAYGIVAYARNDSGTNDALGGATTITDAYHKFRLTFKRATAAAANNGQAYLYIDDVLVASKTNSDNDAVDWDNACFGLFYTDQAADWTGTFYIDECQIANEMLPQTHKALIAQFRDYTLTGQQIDHSLTAKFRDYTLTAPKRNDAN